MEVGDGMILGEMQRQLSKCLTVGIVSEIKGHEVRVTIGRNTTPFIPCSTLRAGGIKIYAMPSLGEQVIVLSPGGSYENAIVGHSLFCDAYEEPKEGGGDLLLEAHGTTIKVSAEGVTITATKTRIMGDVEVSGEVSVTGQIKAQGEIASTADVVAAGISLKTHVHGGVLPGPSVTSPPS